MRINHVRQRLALSVFVVLAVAATTAGGIQVAFNSDSVEVLSIAGRSVGESSPTRSVGEPGDLDGIDQALAAEGVAITGSAEVNAAGGGDPSSASNNSNAVNEANDANATEGAASIDDASPSRSVSSSSAQSASDDQTNDEIASPATSSAPSRVVGESVRVVGESARVVGGSATSAPTRDATSVSATQPPSTSSPTTFAPNIQTPIDRYALVPEPVNSFQEPATTTSTTTSTTSTSTTSTSTTAPATTTTSTTSAPATTTTAPATTTTAAPAPSGGPGCTSNCQTVGFQDLSNQNGVTLTNMIISNPGGRCLDLIGASNITLRNVTIENCGTSSAVTSPSYANGLIRIENANGITIENSIIRNMSNENFGGSRNNAIQITSSSNVYIRNNSIRDVHSNINDNSDDRGNRAIMIEGSSSNVSISGNHLYNAGRNGVQISRVRNASGLSITNNTIEGRGRWDSDYEDIINLYSSSGTSGSPIRISGNTIRNGGPSDSGTGIILGDGDRGRGPTQYVVVENNRFIDPGHVGINVAGGDHITVRNNTIVGTGSVPHSTTVGMTINHFGYSAECRDHVITGNRVYMENQHLPDGVNHLWNPGTCTQNVQLSGNVFGDSSLR